MHQVGSPAHIESARSVHLTALWIVGAVGFAVIGAGVVLVWLGATGQTEMTLFGNSFKAESVGAVGIFCGVVMVVLVIRRVMKSLAELGALRD